MATRQKNGIEKEPEMTSQQPRTRERNRLAANRNETIVAGRRAQKRNRLAANRNETIVADRPIQRRGRLAGNRNETIVSDR